MDLAKYKACICEGSAENAIMDRMRVPLYDIVMMAIVKMKQSPEGIILRGFCYGDDIYANETEKTVLLSGLSKFN